MGSGSSRKLAVSAAAVCQLAFSAACRAMSRHDSLSSRLAPDLPCCSGLAIAPLCFGGERGYNVPASRLIGALRMPPVSCAVLQHAALLQAGGIAIPLSGIDRAVKCTPTRRPQLICLSGEHLLHGAKSCIRTAPGLSPLTKAWGPCRLDIGCPQINHEGVQAAWRGILSAPKIRSDLKST